MADLSEVKDLFDKFKKTEDEFKASNDERLAGIEKKFDDVVTSDKVEKIVTDLVDIKSALDELEKKANRPAKPEAKAEQEGIEHKDAFLHWMRTDEKGDLPGLEKKAVTVGSAAGGGHAVPEIISRQIEKFLLEISEVRDLVNVVQVASPDYKQLADVRGTASGWSGESDTRTETATSTLEQVTFPHGELYALPKASEWSLNDIFFDVENWISMSVAEEFAFQEGAAVVSGNGTNRPSGFLSGPAPVATDDATRPFGTLQYVPTGSATSLDADAFITMAYTPKAGYRANSRWAMAKATLGEVMKLKDGDGNYLWTMGDVTGQPTMRLVGYPVRELEAMPSIAADAFPIAFGDFRKAYTLMDVVGMRMTRDEVTEKGFVLYYTRKRLGGNLVNTEALKLMRIATS